MIGAKKSTVRIIKHHATIE